MMEINKKDLRKMSRSFRIIANRTINAHYDEADTILKMFINYIENNHLVFNYICSIDVADFHIAKEVNEVKESFGSSVFSTGTSIEEEIVYTYRILKYIVEQKIPIISFGRSYARSGNYHDMVKGFGTRVILPFVNHIESYLTDIAIDMGYDEETKYNISVNGGQVNIARDQATINATQYNGINVDELDKLVQSIKSMLTGEIAPAEREIINDSIETLQEELKKENPKKGLIKTAISGLQGVYPKIARAVELTAAITSMIKFALEVL